MNNLIENHIDIKKYIIFEDESIIAINKPSGLLSIPDGYDRSIPNLKEQLECEYGLIWVVHRIDKLTSGVLVFAKTKALHKYLSMQFEKRTIIKQYVALMHGFPYWENKTIDLPLLVNGDRRHRTVVDLISGKKSTTTVSVIKKNKIYTYVRIFPKSGYTHQIRCHLAALGHPLIGDDLYGFFKYIDQKYKFVAQRLYLHAETISLILADDTELNISAPIPKEFASFKFD